MADKGLSSRVLGLASQAVSNPVGKAARAVGVARGVTGAAYGALRGRAASDTGSATAQDASLSTVEPAGGAPAEDTLDSARSDDDETTDETTDTGAGADAGADADTDTGGSAPAVNLLPYPQLDEPIPIVEDVLAAEEENGPPVGGHATEPHASTRDEAHGDARLQRAEQEEIAEEVAEAFPGGDLDIETSVGTTGADVASNPDTAEAG